MTKIRRSPIKSKYLFVSDKHRIIAIAKEIGISILLMYLCAPASGL